MQVRHDSIVFPPDRGAGPRDASRIIRFREDFRSVASVLTGFTASFYPHDADHDHELGSLNVRLDARRYDAAAAMVTATFGLRDWSGEWDDQYEGEVFFAVITD